MVVITSLGFFTALEGFKGDDGVRAAFTDAGRSSGSAVYRNPWLG